VSGAQSLPAIRTMLIVGPILTCIGIAWTAIAPSSFSNAAILVGFATCVYGTHRFGRLGPERPANDGP
jgi:hypothetical protein